MYASRSSGVLTTALRWRTALQARSRRSSASAIGSATFAHVGGSVDAATRSIVSRACAISVSTAGVTCAGTMRSKRVSPPNSISGLSDAVIRNVSFRRCRRRARHRAARGRRACRRWPTGPRSSSPLDPACADPVEQQRQQFELDAARKFAEQRRVVDADVAVGQLRPGAVPMRGRPCGLRHQREVALSDGTPDSGPSRDGRAAPSRSRSMSAASGSSPRVVEGRPDVAGDDERRPVGQQRHRGGDAARGLERLRPRATSGCVTPCARPSPTRVDQRSARCDTLIAMSRMPARASASICQTMSGLPRDLEQRLRRRVRQRAHALAAAGGEDHRADHRVPSPSARAADRRATLLEAVEQHAQAARARDSARAHRAQRSAMTRGMSST